MTELEKEVERLKIKLEALVDYLNVSGTFGPPHGRGDYDKLVRSKLEKEDLLE